MKIFKYKIENLDCLVEIPKDYRILDVQLQGSDLVLWAEVDPDSPITELHVVVALTGDEVPDGGYEHVRTLQIGVMVYHIYVRYA